jgi:hypothetical protein
MIRTRALLLRLLPVVLCLLTLAMWDELGTAKKVLKTSEE